MKTLLTAALLAAGTLPASSLLAQEESGRAPKADPVLTDPSLADIARRLTTGRGAAPGVPTLAAPQPHPVEPAEGSPLPVGTPIPEGTFIPPSRATVLSSQAGERVAVLHPQRAGQVGPAFVLLPAPELERLDRIRAETPDSDPVVLISGQVFRYKDRMYLLPASIARATPPAEGNGEGAGNEGAAAEATPALQRDDPALSAILADLESARSRQRALEALPDTSPPPSEGVQPAPVDAFVVRQVGRVLRDRGVWTFHPDNDDGSAEPMVFLPCRNLETIERLAADRGAGVRFVISGRVVSYRGVRFLLPVLYQVEAAGDVRPLQ